MATAAHSDSERQQMAAALAGRLPALCAGLPPAQPHQPPPVAGPPPPARITGLQRLSAGATLHTWAFDIEAGEGAGLRRWPLILRGSPTPQRSADALPLATEAALLQALGQGSPALRRWVPQVLWRFGLGSDDAAPLAELQAGFVMHRLPGETLVRRLQRDAAFAPARQVLAGQLGAALGAIHRAVDPAAEPQAAAALAALRQRGELPTTDAADTQARLAARVRALPRPSPVMAFAARWLREHLPPGAAQLAPGDWGAQPVLVHADFRLGNVIVAPDGLSGVLDWELAKLGDPAQDLAWITVPPWRFGALQLPVGGIGTRGAFHATYEAATGWRIDPARLRWWQAAGSLWWGLACAQMAEAFSSGRDATLERGMIARRTSESELDLLRLLAPRRQGCPA